MSRKSWFRFYGLIAGSTILTLGIILIFRLLKHPHAWTGFVLGGALVFYGIMRLRRLGRSW